MKKTSLMVVLALFASDDYFENGTYFVEAKSKGGGGGGYKYRESPVVCFEGRQDPGDNYAGLIYWLSTELRQCEASLLSVERE